MGLAAPVTGLLCGTAVVVLFSGFTLVSRLGFQSSLGVLDLSALRFGIGGLLMLPVLLHYGMGGIRWRDAALLALTGGLGFALSAYTGFLLAPASHGAVLLHGTLPVFTVALAWLVPSVPEAKRNASGIAAILMGVVAMAADSVAACTPRQLLGDGALLLASMSWSAYGLLARRFGLAPAHSASIVAVLSMAAFLPAWLVLADKGLMQAPWRDLVLQGLFQGVLVGAVSIFVYSRAVAALGARDTALFTAAVPCVTTLAAAYLLGEAPGTLALGGVMLVSAGMALSLRPVSPERLHSNELSATDLRENARLRERTMERRCRDYRTWWEHS